MCQILFKMFHVPDVLHILKHCSFYHMFKELKLFSIKPNARLRHHFSPNSHDQRAIGFLARKVMTHYSRTSRDFNLLQRSIRKRTRQVTPTLRIQFSLLHRQRLFTEISSGPSSLHQAFNHEVADRPLAPDRKQKLLQIYQLLPTCYCCKQTWRPPLVC